jgi:hypothetical protein
VICSEALVTSISSSIEAALAEIKKLEHQAEAIKKEVVKAKKKLAQIMMG